MDSGGFESSAGYTLGALEGQQGWVTTIGNAGSATVQNSVSHPSGSSQAVRVDRGAGTDDRWAVPVGNLGFPQHRFILVDWDMRTLATGAPVGTGPFLGVETYDATSGFEVLGSFGVDATTGDVLYQAQGTGVLTDTNVNVNPGQWHHFQIKLDFGLNQYQILLDQTALVSTGFVDGLSSPFSNTFTDADIAALAGAVDGTSQNLTGTAFFDNFLVRDVSRADFDIDGDVDDLDLSTWAGAYGINGAGDANLDGDSDGEDFLIWQRDFDNNAALQSLASSAVPEPSSLALFLLAALSFKVRIR